nr:ESF1 homolog [Coffea arabica]XP_027071827.1 ESF1 homolog [Coffea arabica]
MKQSARKKQNAQAREPSVKPSDEQMEEIQSEGHPVSGNEEELEQPTNVDVTTMKSPRKGKRTDKRKSIAQPKERGGSVSAGRTFKLRDEEDEDVQVIQPSIKSPKKKTENRGGKTKQSARKKHNVQTREPSVEPSDEQMEEIQSEGHPVSGNEEELEQPTNVDVTDMKSPMKGKRTAKKKRIAQPKGRKSPRTRSGVQSTEPTTQRSGKRKHPENEQPETQTAVESTPLPKFIDDEIRERFEWISQKGFITQKTIIPYEFHGLMMTMTSDQQATFVAKRNLLVPPIPPENENAHRKEPRTEPTTKVTPEYRASSSQSQDKGKTPATEKETEEDDDDEDENTEEEDPVQFRLARRRPGFSKITI